MPFHTQAEQAAKELRNEAEYTPAPWGITQKEHNGDDLLEINAADRHITVLHFDGYEDFHNARLIAAAPELLEALKAMVNKHINDHGLLLVGSDHSVGKASILIAKCEGK